MQAVRLCTEVKKCKEYVSCVECKKYKLVVSG